MVDEYVARLDVTVHDASAVAEVERLQQLVHVVPHVIIGHRLLQFPKVHGIDEVKDKARRACVRVPQHLQQPDDARPARDVAQDLHFPPQPVLLDGLHDLDDALRAASEVYALENLAVLALAQLAHYGEGLQSAPLHVGQRVIPVLRWVLQVDAGVHARHDSQRVRRTVALGVLLRWRHCGCSAARRARQRWRARNATYTRTSCANQRGATSSAWPRRRAA
mmetsp:Transcript_44029/g.131981  ORF Transcript_44029/g.131981 Transcript_44029/m.131981 type:complete len:221 (-) Transcript_44029:144-806(-)